MAMASRAGWTVSSLYVLVSWTACAPAMHAHTAPQSDVPAAAAPVRAPSRAERQALRFQAMEAYRKKDWATCAQRFDRAHDLYGSACCHAQAGDRDPAFALLVRAIDDGLRDQDLERDSDLEPLHDDPRWPRELAHMAAKAAERSKTLNAELIQIHHDDQADRAVGAYEKIDWAKVAPRDQARRTRVDEILAAGGAKAADDYYHAAMVYQHGNSPDEIQRAHDLAVRAVELDPAHDAARWLAAASEDRKLMYEHKPQKWGTQYKKLDGTWVVWEVDPAITDAARAEWNVQPLAAAQAFVDRMNAALNAQKNAHAAPAEAHPANAR